MTDRGASDPSEPPPSSFPISSPSFWNEAAKVPTPPPVSKRYHSSDEDTPIGPQDDDHTSTKRARLRSPTTTLSYLPNRLDPISNDDPHSYLANPEYAPNRFGDIGDYMRKKEVKVQTQNRDIALASAAEGVPQIFSGLSFYINGNTHPPMEEIRKLILQRGGEVRPVLRSKGMVKFIIAPMLTQSKFKQFERYKVVREGWVMESVKEGRLLDWTRWKLQVQGGWEEGSRKGLEGFFSGKGTQRQKLEEEAKGVKEEDDLDGDPGLNSSSAALVLPPSSEADALPSSDIKVDPTIEHDDPRIPKPPVTPPRTPIPAPVSASSKSLLRPIKASPIPISPGAKCAETPAKEKIAAKVHKPEGWWEHYYSKDSNEDAARLLKDQEWRLKNTAERGNEGGFIDGYYQNSR